MPSLSWELYNSQNQEMVDKFTRLAIISSKEVENAFRCVSRAAFVSKDLLKESFVDAPLRGSPHIHMSAPHMYAAILEDLELEPGMAFLNIGSGTGYFSCLAGYMIKKLGINHGIELHEDLIKFSQERVNDFLAKGPLDAKEICTPLFIAGNCFQLDSSQMKYDRLYCGGACTQSAVTFFLEFLKVGGFLVAPVGTKLIKLERVSHKEGVKTVISDVCFAPLTCLDATDITKLRHGVLPLLRFPIKTKRHKPKKTVFANTNFHVSSSNARKKLSRLRAIQDVLDCLMDDGNIPLPFCYVPQMDQMNTYKQYKKTQLSTFSSSIPSTQSSTVNERVSSPLQTSSNQLMTISEFLLAASPPANFREYFTHVNENISTQNNQVNEQETFIGPRLLSSSRETAPFVTNELSSGRIGRSMTTATPATVSPKDNDIVHDVDIGESVSNDIWEHMCSDKLWETVVDYYYSVCVTTPERRNKCFQLKGIEIVNQSAAKLADVLLFKMQSKQNKTKKVANDVLPSVSVETPSLECSHNQSSETPVVSDTDMLVSKDDDLIEVTECVDKIIETICNTPDERSKVSDDTLNNVLPLRNTEGSFVNCSDTVNTSEEDLHVARTLKTIKKNPVYVDILTDDDASQKLSQLDNASWSIELDVELISFLVSQEKETENFTLRDNLPNIINPEIFEKSKLSKYPQISSIHPCVLTYRSIALIRISKIIDSVLDLLVGPTLLQNQFDNPFQEKYSLVSLTDHSFEASDSQFNVLEAHTFGESKQHKLIEETFTYQEASSSHDKNMLKEVNSMISYEMNNVKQQQLILMRKLELIDNIDEQYKEQVKLLNQQVDLIEEQQRLLSEVHIDVTKCNDNVASQIARSQQIVTDRKQQRQVLLVKRDNINTDRTNQLTERKELLSMLEQLLSLETRLKTEIMSLEKKGMGYLRGQGNDLSNFSQFVRKAEKILNRLKTTSNRMTNVMDKNRITETTRIDELNNLLSFRYQPQTILPRCRFLLPLSKKRYSYIKEMLRSTERPVPRHMPIISVDRRTPISERSSYGENSTVFMQLYQGLRNKDLHYRWNKKTYEQWWEVKFTGEGIIDQGGGFRDSLTEISEELCLSDPNINSCLSLFIKTPNHRSGVGDHLDCYTLNSSCKHFHLYHWLGQLMGACFRTDETIPLSLPPLIWKFLVGEHVTWKKDFSAIDEAAVRNIDGLENLDKDAYVGLRLEQTYCTTLSDQSEIKLISNGEKKVVSCSERSTYSFMVRKARMMENYKQVKALRDGLISVVPEAVLSCLTWKNLERGVCGNPRISVADLKANCRYGDDLKASNQSVMFMWAALASFTDEERSRFIRFITGRKRLPSPFIISSSSVDRDNLPSASTCGSNLFLPEYSSLVIAKEKLRYAIYNCIAIDTDTSPW